MKEGDKIRMATGTENPFRVPDGYFENLASEIMNRLPEKEEGSAGREEPTVWQKIRPWLYMAAMFVGAALIIRVASSGGVSADDRMVAEEAETEMEYIDMAVENSMMDDYSLYIYLADADAE